MRSLSVMVRQYLGVSATSASAERLFSIAGRVYDDLRQRMKEEMLEMVMWARVNREKRHAKRSSSLSRLLAYWVSSAFE